MTGPATAILIGRTGSWNIKDARGNSQRCRRPRRVDTGQRNSVRYDGAKLCEHDLHAWRFCNNSLAPGGPEANALLAFTAETRCLLRPRNN